MSAPGRWAQAADDVLSTLFVAGKPEPSRKEVSEAYPFGPRKHHPYKVWVARCAAWRRAFRSGLLRPPVVIRTKQRGNAALSALETLGQGRLL